MEDLETYLNRQDLFDGDLQNAVIATILSLCNASRKVKSLITKNALAEKQSSVADDVDISHGTYALNDELNKCVSLAHTGE